jgi:hypothetical protein
MLAVMIDTSFLPSSGGDATPRRKRAVKGAKRRGARTLDGKRGAVQ